LGISLVPLALLAASFYSSQLFHLLHSLVNIFAGGRSSIKVGLFLVTVSVLFCLALMPRIKAVSKNVLTSLIIVSLCMAFLINLSAFIFFTASQQVRLTDFLVVFNNNEISSSKLLHNHTLKGAMGLIMERFDQGAQENLDTGLAYVGIVPSSLLYITIGLLALLIVLFGYYFILSVPRESFKKTVWYTLAYAIVAFSLVKNVIDGGLFNRETPVALAGLLIILFYPRRLTSYIVIGLLSGYTLLVLGLYFAGSITQGELKDIAYMGTAFALGLCVLLSGWLKEKLNRQFWLLAVLSLLFIGYSVFSNWSAVHYRKTAIAADGAIVGLYQAPGNQNFRSIETIGKLGLYEYIPDSPTRIDTVLKDYQLLDNLHPVMVPWQTCFPRSQPEKYRFELVTGQQLPASFPFYRFIQIEHLRLTSSGNLNRYQATLSLDPCTPRPLNVIGELFHSIGVDEFVLINITQDNGSRPD
jgi:hypothetical protein